MEHFDNLGYCGYCGTCPTCVYYEDLRENAKNNMKNDKCVVESVQVVTNLDDVMCGFKL